MANTHFRGRERSVRIDPAKVMSRAWEIFRDTYRYPATPFSSIGRRCFTWALRTAWEEARYAARIAATSSETLQARIDAIEVELDGLKYRGFSTLIAKRIVELRAQARPLIAELFRRSIEAEPIRLAA